MTLTPRRRAPNLKECKPSASVVVFVTSQRLFPLKESPTVAPPDVNESSTLTANASLSAAWFVWLRMNWKRVSLTVFLLSTAVSVSCSWCELVSWLKARSGSENCETPRFLWSKRK